MAFEITTEEQNQLQHDILTTKTSENPLFVSSPIASKNKALETSDKRIVGAVNELKKNSEQTLNIVEDNLGGFLAILGDYKTNPELKDNLLNVGSNIISIILEMDAEIKRLKEQTSNGGSSNNSGCEGLRWEQEFLEYQEESLLYELKYKNILQADFELTINGVEYQECDDFVLDAEAGTILWTSNELTLDLEDEIVAQYFISSSSELKNPE